MNQNCANIAIYYSKYRLFPTILILIPFLALFQCRSGQNKPGEAILSDKKENLRSNIPEFTSAKDTEKRLTPHYDELKKLDKNIDKKSKP
jgi:hypothetical protein